MRQHKSGRGRASKVVTVIITALVALFAGLIALTMLDRREPTGAQGGGSGGAAQAGGPGGGTGAGAGGGQGGAQAGGQSAGNAGPAGGTGGGQGGAGAGASGAQGAGQRSGGARAATTVRATPVALGTVENRVVINGDVLARSQVSIYPTVAGKLTETRVQVGDRVSQGQVVAMVDPSRPGELYSQSPVASTIAGTVLQAPMNPGDTVSSQTVVYVVGNLSSLVVETFVPERFSTSVRTGLPAQVSFEAMPGESFGAAVEEVSPVLDPASRTLRIRLRFTPGAGGRVDSRIKAGMFGTVSLVTNSRQDVPVVPRAAVINTYGNWVAFVVREDNTAERRVLRLGLEDETSFEVLEGLSMGEQVVTAGQNFLSEGDLVRIIE